MGAVALVLFLPHLNFAVDNWEGYNTRTKAVYILNEENRVQFGDKNAVRDHGRADVAQRQGVHHPGLEARLTLA